MLTALYSVATDPAVYERHQARLGVAERSGFSQEELCALDDRVAGYLRGENALEEADFSRRELMHMQDVQWLVFLCRNVMILEWILSALAILCVCFKFRWKAPEMLLRGAWGALGAIACAVGMIVLIAAVNFRWAFTMFHKMLFTNDLWLLSASSTLIRMFPEDFFRAMGVEIVVRFGIMLIVALGLGKGFVYYANTRR